MKSRHWEKPSQTFQNSFQTGIKATVAPSLKCTTASLLHRFSDGALTVLCCSQVVFVKRLAAFSTLPFQQFHCEQSHDIYFSDAQIHTRFRCVLSVSQSPLLADVSHYSCAKMLLVKLMYFFGPP